MRGGHNGCLLAAGGEICLFHIVMGNVKRGRCHRAAWQGVALRVSGL